MDGFDLFGMMRTLEAAGRRRGDGLPVDVLEQMMGGAAAANEEEELPKPVKCPVCMKKFPYRPGGEATARVDDRCSHDARLVYCEANCSVCLEDAVPPPNVVLPCGHVVCRDDFRGLGGRTGRGSMLSAERVAEIQLNERQEERRRQWREFYRNSVAAAAAEGGNVGPGGRRSGPSHPSVSPAMMEMILAAGDDVDDTPRLSDFEHDGDDDDDSEE